MTWTSLGSVTWPTTFRLAVIQAFSQRACLDTGEIPRVPQWLFPLGLQLKSTPALLPPLPDAVPLMV